MKYEEIKETAFMKLRYVQANPRITGKLMEKVTSTSGLWDVEKLSGQLAMDNERTMEEIILLVKQHRSRAVEMAAEDYAVNELFIEIIDKCLDEMEDRK